MICESHVQFADWCAPVKISNSAEYSVLQALQFEEVRVRRIIPGGTGIRTGSLVPLVHVILPRDGRTENTSSNKFSVVAHVAAVT
jgi:hypothetical protein